MKIGFTGTHKGMTEFQRKEVNYTLTHRLPSEVHHGDCIGADTDFHNLCLNEYPIIIHPSNLITRAWNKGADITLEPKPPLVRNHNIVDSVDIMIATPKGRREELRSGTWATIRYCRKRGKPVYVIYP